jgi:pilus assembly protein CpaF
MVAMATLNLPERAVRQQIVAALTLVVQITRLSDGSRRVVNVAEITGMESDMISMQDIFTFVRRGIGPSGRVAGVFRPTGIRPKFLDKLRVAGIVLPLEIFEKTLDVS